MAEADAMGLKVMLPDVNMAFARFSPVKDENAIVYGLAGIKGVGEGAANAIVEERGRNGPYKGFLDFAMRLASNAAETGPDGKKAPPVLNKRVLENLVRAGAFDSFIAADPSMHRARFFHNVDFVLKRATARAAEKASGQTDFFAMIETADECSDKELPDCPPFPAAENFKGERDLTGMYMTGHPLGAFRRVLGALSTFKIAEPPEIPFMEEVGAPRPIRVPVRLAGMLKSCQVRMSKPKKEGELPQPWAILTLDDSEGEMEALAFAKTYAKYKTWLPDEVDRPVLLCGELAHRTNRDTKAEEDGIQFVVREAYPLEQGINTFAKTLTVTLRFEDPQLAARAERIKEMVRRFPGVLPLNLELLYADGRRVFVGLPGGVAATDEFFTALDGVVLKEHYRLDAKPDIFAEPPERKPWEKK